jgi:tetratricopeptide (TPR) repeat protein
MLALGAAIAAALQRIPELRRRRLVVAAVQLAVVAGVVRSALRTTVWRDNETLFSTGVRDAPLAYRSHYVLAGWRFSNQRLREGEQSAITAMKLFPQDVFAPYNLGEEYRKAGMFPQAIRMFRRALEIVPHHREAQNRLAMSLANLGEYPEAANLAAKAIQNGTSEYRVMREILIAAAEERRGAGSASRAILRPDSVASGKSPETRQNALHSGGSTGR